MNFNSLTYISGDLRIGFGSFVDKPLSPFKSTNEEYNCPADKDCIPPYSFQHRIDLSKMDVQEFEDKVKKIKLSGNVDTPEGGLDALLQVMSCKESIGYF